MRLRLSESVCTECKTLSKTSETQPFPPISYPALAVLIGIPLPRLGYAHAHMKIIISSTYSSRLLARLQTTCYAEVIADKMVTQLHELWRTKCLFLP